MRKKFFIAVAMLLSVGLVSCGDDEPEIPAVNDSITDAEPKPEEAEIPFSGCWQRGAGSVSETFLRIGDYGESTFFRCVNGKVVDYWFFNVSKLESGKYSIYNLMGDSQEDIESISQSDSELTLSSVKFTRCEEGDIKARFKGVYFPDYDDSFWSNAILGEWGGVYADGSDTDEPVWVTFNSRTSFSDSLWKTDVLSGSYELRGFNLWLNGQTHVTELLGNSGCQSVSVRFDGTDNNTMIWLSNTTGIKFKFSKVL